MEKEIFDKVCDNNANVQGIMLRLKNEHPENALQTMLDLLDMEMTGEQVWEAYQFCDHHLPILISFCAMRNSTMVERVNTVCAPKVARQHGPQRTIPVRDAVQEVIADAQKNELLQRIDEGAEAFNRIFMAMLTQMQKTQQFTNILKINTGVNGQWAVFSITLQEIQNADGSTYTGEE
jgi:hypothetical protein